jgi:hypothetical protein
MCAPFGWFTDESLLLPAVLAGVYRAVSARRSLLPLGLISVVALIEVFREVDLTSRYYLWSTPAWLGWYLYATRKSGTDPLSSALHWQFRRHRIPADDRQE